MQSEAMIRDWAMCLRLHACGRWNRQRQAFESCQRMKVAEAAAVTEVEVTVVMA